MSQFATVEINFELFTVWCKMGEIELAKQCVHKFDKLVLKTVYVEIEKYLYEIGMTSIDDRDTFAKRIENINLCLNLIKEYYNNPIKWENDQYVVYSECAFVGMTTIYKVYNKNSQQFMALYEEDANKIMNKNKKLANSFSFVTNYN